MWAQEYAQGLREARMSLRKTSLEVEQHHAIDPARSASLIARNDAISIDFLEGMSAGDLAQKYDLAVVSIYKVLQRCGVTRAKKEKRAPKEKPFLRRERLRERNGALALDFSEGMSNRDLAQKYGLHCASVGRVLKKLDLSRPKKVNTVDALVAALEAAVANGRSGDGNEPQWVVDAQAALALARGGV